MELEVAVCELRSRFHEELQAARNTAAIELLKTSFLGKKGPLQAMMQELRTLPSELRPAAGREINLLKQEIEERLFARHEELLGQEEGHRLADERLDVTLPGRTSSLGGTHLIANLLWEMVDLLVEMGFSIYSAPEVDTDEYNFGLLNFSEDHPARDMQDTFYLPGGFLLRTHATNAQVRALRDYSPPLRVVSGGCVFRNEAITARSHIFFHQIDVLYVAKGVTFGDLLATLRRYLVRLMGEKVDLRFRPSYFPFVEPGVEVDISCTACCGEGCSLCKESGWLEVAGAGLVHPSVLRNGGVDPEEYSGFAWGMGVERIALLRYGIDDIRRLSANDLRFLKQFSWLPT